MAVSAAPTLSICGEIVNLRVSEGDDADFDGGEDIEVVMGACLVEESGQFSEDNCVLWKWAQPGHSRGGTKGMVVIGKGVPVTGSTVRYDMPQENYERDDEYPPPYPGLNVGPQEVTQLRLGLNSRRELLFKLDNRRIPEEHRGIYDGGWVNVTPEGGLREGVSELHLVSGCYNSYDNENFEASFSRMGSYIKVWSLKLFVFCTFL